ncbi:MAG: ExbD/TolR family protein [Candidatus Rifleibacteriota bacterium]
MRRRRLRDPQKQFPMLDLTGASDIIFTLLLFYILSQNFLPSLSVSLPALNSTSISNSKDEQYLTIHESGMISYNEYSFSLPELKKSRTILQNLQKERTVTIKSDKKARAEILLGLLDQLALQGFSDVNFIGLPDEHSD